MSTIEQAIEEVPPEQNADIKEVKVDELEQLRNDLAAANKRINDTYAQYQAGQERISLMERAIVERERQANRPPLLDETEGLQEAIKFVAQSERDKPTDDDRWTAIVARGVPGAAQLLNDERFYQAAQEARQRVGERAWKDPVVAIAEIGNLKAEYLKQRAIEEDRRARSQADDKTNAMDIPGGSGKAGRRDPPVDEVKRIWDLPMDEFRKMRDKVMTG